MWGRPGRETAPGPMIESQATSTTMEMLFLGGRKETRFHSSEASHAIASQRRCEARPGAPNFSRRIVHRL
jgi:hypothetical protein